MNITAITGWPMNMAAALNLDLYNAVAGMTDSWLFLGDSITAEGMAHGDIAGGAWAGGDYGQLIAAAAPPYYPLQMDGGMGYWTSATGAAAISALLANFPGHYVSLAFGTNDTLGPYLHSQTQIQNYYKNLLTMIHAVQAEHKVTVVPKVIWGCSGDLGQNAYVAAHLKGDAPRAVVGPDLYTAFQANPSWISKDCIHPTYSAPAGQLSGFEQYQRVWVRWALATIYHH